MTIWYWWSWRGQWTRSRLLWFWNVLWFKFYTPYAFYSPRKWTMRFISIWYPGFTETRKKTTPPFSFLIGTISSWHITISLFIWNLQVSLLLVYNVNVLALLLIRNFYYVINRFLYSIWFLRAWLIPSRTFFDVFSPQRNLSKVFILMLYLSISADQRPGWNCQSETE